MSVKENIKEAVDTLLPDETDSIRESLITQLVEKNFVPQFAQRMSVGLYLFKAPGQTPLNTIFL